MIERRVFQITIAVAGLVPLTAGALGVLDPVMLGLHGDSGALSHAAYLSGLLLGIGLAFWSLIPAIERRGAAFALLAAIVMVGGLGRLLLAARLGAWDRGVVLPLAMELGVTPLLWLWQRRIARNASPPRA